MKLTAAQDRAIRLLVDAEEAEARAHPGGTPRTSPRALARMMWPDSPAWDRRTRKRGSNDSGAMGGTMPMLAAKVLWSLRSHGLVTQHTGTELAYTWSVTGKARAYVAGGARYADGYDS